MEITVISPDSPPPCARCFALSMTIRSFKGRKDVEVHLFRPAWAPEEETALNWDNLIGPAPEQAPGPAGSSRRVVLESFTAEERDRILKYLKEQYATRLKALHSQPLEFPVPDGLPPLSDMGEGKSIGLIRFERIPSYSLDMALCGLYDLSQHPPIVDTPE
ncbi:MAG: hypothetical protein V3573_10690 [Desulfovibrionaceae bacterium]